MAFEAFVVEAVGPIPQFWVGVLGALVGVFTWIGALGVLYYVFSRYVDNDEIVRS